MKGSIFARLFFVIFLAVGLVTGFFSVRHLYTSLQMSNWEEVLVDVHSANADSRSTGSGSDSGTEYFITASYSYTYKGRRFSANRVGIVDKGGFGVSFRSREETLRQYIRDKQPFLAHLNPEDPSQAVLFITPVWDYIGFLSLFTLLFGGVGLGGLLLVGWGVKQEVKEEKLEQQYPNEPWRWNPMWTTGTILSQDRGKLIGVWFFTVFWNALSSPVLFAFPDEWSKGNHAIVIGLLFPLVGAWLFVLAIRTTLAWRKFGSSKLQLDTLPGVIGGSLRGTLELPCVMVPSDGFSLTLECTQTVSSGSGKNKSSSIKLLWQEQFEVQTGATPVSRIPFEIIIPYSCKGTDENQLIDWHLKVVAAVPGVDYNVSIPVPVFKTAKSNPEVQHGEMKSAAHLVNSANEQPSLDGIEIQETGNGFQLYLSPMLYRSPKTVLGVFLFALVWTGMMTGLVLYTDIPLIFPIVMGFIELILVLILLDYCFKHVTLKFSSGSIDRESKFLFYRFQNTYTKNEIEKMRYRIGSQGSVGRKHFAYYTIEVKLSGPQGKWRRVLDSLTSKSQARWLMGRIGELLGIQGQEGSYNPRAKLKKD